MAEWRRKRSIMRLYNASADCYDGLYGEEQNAKIKAAMKRIRLDEQSCALDLGCGTGRLFDHVAATAGTVVGVDISKRTLAAAKNRCRGLHNVSLILADADYLPFLDGVFSHIFALTTLQNMPNPLRTLEEAERVAKKNAVYAVTGLKKIFSQNQFLELLNIAGLKIVTFEDEESLKCYVAICIKNNIETSLC
ncbi:methyltransferase domain-containing protein [Candidatus Bathyarchaeota archaeon]|nr:methyltransferase domain-containing protein [Candidatus Bathyarchaeota archaeon]